MKKTHSATSVAAALLLTMVSSSAQNVISMNFDGQGGTGTPGPVTGVAGSVPASNWNNSGVTGLSGPLALVDDTGAASGATVNWTVANQWTTNGADNSGTDAQMMQGYLDNFHGQAPIIVDGIPGAFTAGGYELRIYHNTDSAGTMGFTVDDGVSPITTYYSHQSGGNNSNYPLAGVDPFGGAPGYVGSQDTNSATTTLSNYTLFTGLSGATLTITGVQGTSGDGRSRPNGFQIVSTAPVVDSDGDGLPDSWETLHNLDPNDDGSVDPVNGAAGDPDADTLSNLEEFNRGTDPRDDDSDDDNLGDAVEDKTGIYVSPTQTGSDPNNPDSDGDTLQDGAEVEANPFVTDPNNPDTDGDGLDDASEEAANPFVTDPTKEDTDGDGVSDGVEIVLGSDPTDPNDVPNVVGTRVISVNFDGQGGTGTPGPVTGVAGSVAVGNWNNSGVSGLSGPLALVDDTGAPTGASVNWTVGNQWTTNGGDNGGTDAQMMQGYLDNFHAQAPMTVTGIPGNFTAGGYELRVYHNTDSGGTMGFTVDDGNGPTTYYSHQPGGNNSNYPLGGIDPFGGAAGYIGSQDTIANTTTPSNYTLFTGLTGPTLTIVGVAGGAGDGRSRPNGFQIVANVPAVDDDMDGLDDNWETAHGLDPTDDGSTDINNGPDGDPDNDGSNNLKEFESGTDPQDDDSDDDNLLDGVETDTGIYVSETDTGTSPRDDDTDGDGLKDGEEVTTHQTDPTAADSDADGYEDGVEISAGTDPNDPNSKPALLPIGYWSFDDQGAGGTTADLSPGGNDGTLIGDPEVVEGPCGAGDTALKFDGIDDAVTTTASLLNGLTEFTMSGWVKYEVTPPNRSGFFGQNDCVEFGYINGLHHWSAAGGAVDTPLPATLPWTHILVTGDPTERKVYLDGVLSMTGGPSAAPTSAFTFKIGGDGVFDATGNFFTGCIDDVAVWDKVLPEADIIRLAACEITPLGRPRSGVGVEITEVRRTAAGNISISWKSRLDRQYDVLTNPDLSTPRDSWAEVVGAQDLAADPSGITTVEIAQPFPETGYFAIRAEGLPPIFSEDFESGAAGWTSGSDGAAGTLWELGAPTVVGPLTAESGTNCFGTNIGDNFAINANVWARSPNFTLGGVPGELVYYQHIDTDDFGGDLGSITVHDASDDSVIGVLADDISGIPVQDWEKITYPLPAAAVGKEVYLVFRFVSNDTEEWSGWYFDSILVRQ